MTKLATRKTKLQFTTGAEVRYRGKMRAVIVSTIRKLLRITEVPNEDVCLCGAPTMNGVCADLDCVCKSTHWVPWQLAPSSDVDERWILVNVDDDSEEHPANVKFASADLAKDFARLPIAALTADDWSTIIEGLRYKIKSACVAGTDREAVTWRAHLREIKQAIRDGEHASLNASDWVEIYYALDEVRMRGKSLGGAVAAKIGPDGQYMIAA
jgi:hypothetical protein